MDNEEKVGDADAVVRAMAYLGGVPGTRCDMIEMNREREQALRKIWATAEAAIDLVAPPRVMEMRVTADGRLTFYTSSSLEPEVATASVIIWRLSKSPSSKVILTTISLSIAPFF